MNAGPNYGGLWFECRDVGGGGTCREALRRAAARCVEGVREAKRLYVAAEGRRMGVDMLLDKEVKAKGLEAEGEEWEALREERMEEAEAFVMEDADPGWVGGGIAQAFEGGWSMDVWRMLSSVI